MIKFPPPDPALAGLADRNLVFKVGSDQAGERLDKFTAGQIGLSRGLVRALIDFGSVWVRGKVCRQQSRELQPGDWVTAQVPAYGPVRFYEADPDRILYEDDQLLAYDKEAGLPCQQTPYDGYNHLYAALQRRRGGYLALHHRLDRLTSGVMVFALSRRANGPLSRQFREGLVSKIYLAVVQGCPALDRWTEDRPVAKRAGRYCCPEDRQGKSARSEFQVLERGPNRCLVQARPLTGRTHQIRLHLAAAGHLIVGDQTYGGPPAGRLMLHARSLAFDHPRTGEPMEVQSPIPPGFSTASLEDGQML